MGRTYSTRSEQLAEERAAQARLETSRKKTQAWRMELAEKIVMALTDEIINKVIRPGPVAEERECYQMAQETRDHDARLTELVVQILVTEKMFKSHFDYNS